MNSRVLANGLRAMLAVGVMVLLAFAMVRFGGTRSTDRSIIQMSVSALLIGWALLVTVDSKSIPSIVVALVLIPITAYGLFWFWAADVRYLARTDLAHFGMIIGLFLVLHGVFKDQKWGRWFVFLIIAAASAEAFYGVAQFIRKSGTVMGVVQHAAYLGRASGTYINPNHGAWVMSLGLVLSLPLAMLSRESWVTRICCFYAALVCGVGVIATFSRGAWLGVGLALLVFTLWLLWREQPKWFGWTSLALLLVCGGIAVGYASKALERQGRDSFEDIRLTTIWPAAIKVWQEQPLIGVGPGQFADHYRKYRPGEYGAQTNPVRTHNDYLNILADWGVVGFFMTIGSIALVSLGLLRRLRRSPDTEALRSKRRAQLIGLLLAGVYMIVHASTDFNLYVPANAMLLIVTVALVCVPAVKEQDMEKERCRYPGWQQWTWGLLGVVFAIVLYFHASTRWREERQLAAAIASRAEYVPSLSHLKAAWQICPDNPDTSYRIGDLYRLKSAVDMREDLSDSEESLIWLNRATQLNPRQPHYWIAKGRVEHWLNESVAARASFEKALSLDPNNYRVQAFYGWYLFEVGEYLDSFRWLKRSQWLNYAENSLAKFYLLHAEIRLRKAQKWPPVDMSELRYANPK